MHQLTLKELAETAAVALLEGGPDVELLPGKVYPIIELPDGKRQIRIQTVDHNVLIFEALSGHEETIPGQVVKNFERQVVRIRNGRVTAKGLEISTVAKDGVFDGVYVNDVELECHKLYISGSLITA